MKFNTVLWTSDLLIESESDFDSNKIIETLEHEANFYSSFGRGHPCRYPRPKLAKYLKDERISSDELNNFIYYDNSRVDWTGLMKGYALSIIRDELKQNSNKYLINFGGDILSVNQKCLSIDFDNGTSLKINGGTFSLFTSSNTSTKRGPHILKFTNVPNKSCSVITKYNQGLIRGDMIATQLVSGRVTARNSYHATFYDVTNKFKIINQDDIYSQSIL